MADSKQPKHDLSQRDYFKNDSNSPVANENGSDFLGEFANARESAPFDELINDELIDEASLVDSTNCNRIDELPFEVFPVGDSEADDSNIADSATPDSKDSAEVDLKPSRDFVVYDEPERCPYLANRTARMPLRMPMLEVSREEVDVRLAGGERRSGRFVYKTKCPECSACEAIRLCVKDFRPSRSQKRAKARGDREIETVIGQAQTERQRVDLFNKHRNRRGLSHDGMNIDEDGFSSFLVDSCFETFEFSYYHKQQLIGCAICDRGHQSISAVYCFYDPDFSYLSLGTYSVLKLIDYCLENEIKYLYLGFYVAESQHMKYKSNFRPNQRLINGKWVTFDP